MPLEIPPSSVLGPLREERALDDDREHAGVVKIAANPAASQCATPGMKICGTASVPTIPRKPKMNVAA